MTTRRRSKGRQLELGLKVRSWGGARPGSGPKPKGERKVPHHSRPLLASRHPVHVTVRLGSGLPSLRKKRPFGVVRRAFRMGGDRSGFRVVHYSVQSNHMHLLVEAKDASALSRGMQGLQTRIARGLNGLWARRGKVFADRFHARALKGPREVRHALAYVLLNARKHAAQAGQRLRSLWIDPFSSGACFDGWREEWLRPPRPPDELEVAQPHTWLLHKGWRRFGLLRLAEVPGQGRR